MHESLYLTHAAAGALVSAVEYTEALAFQQPPFCLSAALKVQRARETVTAVSQGYHVTGSKSSLFWLL